MAPSGERAVGPDSISGGDLTLAGAIGVHGEDIAGLAHVLSERYRRLFYPPQAVITRTLASRNGGKASLPPLSDLRTRVHTFGSPRTSVRHSLAEQDCWFAPRLVNANP